MDPWFFVAVSVPVAMKPGDVIGGTYRIERLLGQGGMGAVFVAHEERLGRRVAIKVLLTEVAGNPEAVARFEREARSAAALQSDHVTRVLSVGHLPNGAPYIVMELLDGEDLASLLSKRGALAPLEVAGFMIQICEALAEAHVLGIVHRDLKPANIFLARRPTGALTVKVLDFGISKGATSAASQAPLTRTTAMMGTPLYMSPEQLREARTVDGRADLWALGIIMYELLCGFPPFRSDALAELCVLILTTEPEPLIRRRPDLPPALTAIVSRCLEKDPAKRFATATELMTALAAFVAAPHAMPPRMATPRMSPNELAGMPTAAIVARARAQAPTEGIGQTPAPLQSPTAAYPPPAQAQTPALQPGALAAGTVDPVSNTQPWSPPKRPSLVGLALVFAGALAIGGGAFYVLLVKPATTDASGEGASKSAAAAPSTSAVPSARSSASFLPSPPEASAAASASAQASPAGSLRLVPLTPSPPPVTALPPPPLPGANTPKLPPAPVVVLPAPPSARVPPTASVPKAPLPPSTPPPSTSGSLMPGARN